MICPMTLPLCNAVGVVEMDGEILWLWCCRAWIARRAKLDQCLELQLFNRDCEQAETWMAAREASLEDSVDGSGDSVEALLKKHEDFDRAIASQEEKISAINDLANKVCDSSLLIVACFQNQTIVQK